MEIPFLSKWLRAREAKKQIDVFVKLQMRKAKILDIKRKMKDK